MKQKPVKKKVSPKKKGVKKPVTKKPTYVPKRKVKVRKLRYGRILVVLFLIGFFLFCLTKLVHFPIRNLYIVNNTYLSDQEIIDLAGLRDYPGMFSSTSKAIEKRLKENIYIASAKVKKQSFKQITIEITENIPLFYYKSTNQTLFMDGRSQEGNLASAILINYVPDELYETMIAKMKELKPMILKRISTIQYDPNNVDTERFLLTMVDGNYVYLTLEKFKSINNYVEIMKNIIQTHGNQKGILYLDSGEYFEIMK